MEDPIEKYFKPASMAGAQIRSARVFREIMGLEKEVRHAPLFQAPTCEHCVFLGGCSFRPGLGDETTEYDLYYCPAASAVAFYGRHGRCEGNSYLNKSPVAREALRRAIDKELVLPETVYWDGKDSQYFVGWTGDKDAVS
jgi:hypothetical protein